jgi:hypothetical protein
MDEVRNLSGLHVSKMSSRHLVVGAEMRGVVPYCGTANTVADIPRASNLHFHFLDRLLNKPCYCC